jgi:hypothetical protein
MTERLIDAWRTKADSPTGFTVREFLLAFRRSITLADSVGERSISLGDGESIVSIMIGHLGDKWFDDDFILGLAKEGFTVKYSYVTNMTEVLWSEMESGPYPDELKIVNKEDYPVAIPSGGWTKILPFKSKHISRVIELTWV